MRPDPPLFDSSLFFASARAAAWRRARSSIASEKAPGAAWLRLPRLPLQPGDPVGDELQVVVGHALDRVRVVLVRLEGGQELVALLREFLLQLLERRTHLLAADGVAAEASQLFRLRFGHLGVLRLDPCGRRHEGGPDDRCCEPSVHSVLLEKFTSDSASTCRL